MGQQPSAHVHGNEARLHPTNLSPAQPTDDREQCGPLPTGSLSPQDKRNCRSFVESTPSSLESIPSMKCAAQSKNSKPNPNTKPNANPNSRVKIRRGRGITIVHPQPDTSWSSTKPVELQKLDKVHRFWPILRSSIDTIPPQERITDGLHYREILSMCIRYQEHLSQSASIVGTEQKALGRRLRDIEMFSAGIVQQMIRRQDKMHQTQVHLRKVSDVNNSLKNIKRTLASCVPLVQRLNGFLPEESRLERFKLNPEQESEDDDQTTEDKDEHIVNLRSQRSQELDESQ